MDSMLIGLFSVATRMPALNFDSLNGSLDSSRLINFGNTNSADSNVVNRSLHSMHSLLLRVWYPSPANLESTTLVSWLPQNGQYIEVTY
jgi:hypothetical protein